MAKNKCIPNMIVRVRGDPNKREGRILGTERLTNIGDRECSVEFQNPYGVQTIPQKDLIKIKKKAKCSLKFSDQVNDVGKIIEKEFTGKKRKKALKDLNRYVRSVCD